VATIGFQGSVRRVGGRAVPQYFVMVGGGATEQGATFARLAAKVPARRLTETVERLLDLYERDRQPEESAQAFFARVDTTTVKLVLRDLEKLTEADAVADDFIDLAESSAFAPVIMEGECSA
jgi:sulfite reductase (NADPH) hemoprotein beta-component